MTPSLCRQAAFEALYRQHGRAVWAVAYARLMNADLAMDLTQEVFLRLWKEGENGVTIRHPRTWLLQVARNLAVSQAKSAFHRHGTQPPDWLGGLQGREPLPLERLEQEERFAQVRRAMDRLPALDREVLTLHYALEYDARRIGALLGLRAATVHMRLCRARQRLARRLMPEVMVNC